MKELTCIVCPKGCHLVVNEENNCQVTGNSCERGREYGENELKNPVRVLTSVVKVQGGNVRCCPVKTSGAVPRGHIHEVMNILKSVRIQGPIRIGDVIAKTGEGSDINWIATKNIG